MTHGAAPRRRRYVTAPAGTYPAPVRASRTPEPPSAGAAVAEPPFEDDFDVDAGRTGSGSMHEPDLGALLAAPPSPAFARLAEDRTGVVTGAPPDLEPEIDADDDVLRPAASWARQSRRRMLFGGVAGALVGWIVGFVLLALARPERLAALKDPVGLWHSVNDSRDWLTVALMGVACALLGTAAAAWSRPTRQRQD